MSEIQVPRWPSRIVHCLADQLGTRVWLVGGAVRNLLLARPVHDWDFAVEREAMTLARRVGDALGGAYFPLDRTRDTARVVVLRGKRSLVSIDFAGLRGEQLVADLTARDFTVNAMALDRRQRLIDPLRGEADLERQRIRGASEDVFRRDPLRLLRAPRLEAELGFLIEPATETWIRRDAALLPQAAEERQRDEFLRGLAVPPGSAFVHRLRELSLLIHLIPELEPLASVAQSSPHRFDVWRHTLAVIDVLACLQVTLTGGSEPIVSAAVREVPVAAWGDLTRRLGQFSHHLRDHLALDVSASSDRGTLLTLAALFHDVGKAQTASEDADGRIRFFGHEGVGARITAHRLRKLRFSRDEVWHVRRIVRHHLRPGHLAREPTLTRRAIYRYFRDIEDLGVDVVLLSLADHLATWGPTLREGRWRRRLDVAELLLHHFFERRDETVAPNVPVDGHDLMRELDLEPGPEVGRILAALREAVAAGEIGTREEALMLARALAEGHGGA